MHDYVKDDDEIEYGVWVHPDGSHHSSPYEVDEDE